MCEIRFARKGETLRQKEIWKLCFGDSDSYIDFYYANRYQEDETALLLREGEILAMLTMLPVKTITPAKQSFDSAMFYAIATHPRCQNRGYAAQLISFSNQYLKSGGNELSVLVPANTQLFDYYRKLGYLQGFYIRESLLTHNRIDHLPVYRLDCTISSITPEEYNSRRKVQLNGRLYISYQDEDIAYQKKLSKQSGEDIYALDIGDQQGCLAVEKISPDKVLIKEILLPEEYIYPAVKQIRQQLSAKEYILRTPPYLGEKFGGSIRPFGMIRMLEERESNLVITPDDLGYLGFAFD